jgi:hypothetical protein
MKSVWSWGEDIMYALTRSNLAILYFGIAIVVSATGASAQQNVPRISLKNGESTELREFFYIVGCQSIVIGSPVLDVLEGPEQLTVTIKEHPVLPRGQNCAKEVPGGAVVVTAKDVTRPIEAKLTIRLKFNTKVGERQSSSAYIVSLFPEAPRTVDFTHTSPPTSPADLAESAELTKTVRVGDQWNYDRRNEVTGVLQDTYTSVVAEISPTEIVTNLIERGAKASSIVAFDRSWNRVANGPWRYTPNDAHGIRPALAVGQEWRAEFDEMNVTTNVKFKVTSLSKVLTQETITTPAGTFETFKIERQTKTFNTAHPSTIMPEIQFDLWYAPEINHWVRRIISTRMESRLSSKTSEELTEYSRRQ